MVKRDLDGVYFRVMRDGSPQNVCWTDLVWEDRIEFARKNNNENWLIQMIQIMNDVAYKITNEFPEAPIVPVKLGDGKKTLTWLRNSLFRLTADIRLVAETLDIVAVRE
jgi:hypothetical protein